MKNSNNDEEAPSMDSIRALFGPPPPRRPIPSNSFTTLVKIFSLFPDQNPFSDYSSYANLPECPRWYGGGNQNNPKRPKSGDGNDDSVVARDENKASGESVGPASVEVCNSAPQNEASNDMILEEFCIDDSSGGLDMVTDELCKTADNAETMDNMADDGDRTDARLDEVPKVPEALSGIERILMDDSDDMDLLGLPEKDADFTFLDDYGSILDADICINDTVAAESSLIREMSIEGSTKDDLAGDTKIKDVEVNKSIPGGHTPKSQGCLPVDREMSKKEEAKNQHTGTRLVYTRNKEKKLCKEKGANKRVQSADQTFTAHETNNGGGIVLSGNCVDSVGKENEFDMATKGKIQPIKKASSKDVNSGQPTHISVNGEAPNSTRSGPANSLIAHETNNGGGLISSGNCVDSVGKENKSDMATKGEIQPIKKASSKDVNSGEPMHISVNGKAPNSTRSGPANSLIAHETNNGGGIISSGNCVDSVGKENKSDMATKGDIQPIKKAFSKDVNSGQPTHISANGEAPNSTRSGPANSLIHGKSVKKNARGTIGKSSTTKARKSQSESSKGFQYTREQLLCLRNVSMTASVSEDMLKALQEICAHLHDKGQHSAAGKTIENSGAKKGKQDSPTEAKLANESEMESSVLKNKKRGSVSEARKEKKKRSRRERRAKMNKKLGVKRLKLRPDMKPKVVQDCRHYLQGRCQQGEQCKFSHDLIPLTKSKPCCHFARNACMKGDDCPFDHQLSKYPCKNYVDTGFCIRGDSCLFSHKVSATEGSTSVSGVSKCETNSVLQHDESNSKHQPNAGLATSNSLKGDSARQISLPATAPKGLSFLSFGKSSAENFAKIKQAEQSQQSSGDAAGTRASPNILTETASKINDDGSGKGSQLNQGISSKSVNVCQMFKGSPAPIRPKTIGLSSYSGPSYVSSGDKSQANVPINEHRNCQISEKETADKADKLKAVVQSDSPAFSGQSSMKVGGAKSTPSTAQRALMSTLAFAAKFESGVKMKSAAPSKEVDIYGGTTSDSGSKHNEESKAAAPSKEVDKNGEESKASAILEFLYS